MPKVAEQIVEGARRQASSIIKNAEEQARSIEEAKKALARRKADSMARRAEERAKQIRNQALASARLRARQSEVERKAEILEGVFQVARDRLGRIPLSKVLSKKAAGDLLVAKRDVPWARKNCKGKVAEADILGGYVLESEGVVQNNSFDIILEDIRGEFSAKILKSVKG
jgi:vacuolar-type H+-ATPase subunit E/Vma4